MSQPTSQPTQQAEVYLDEPLPDMVIRDLSALKVRNILEVPTDTRILILNFTMEDGAELNVDTTYELVAKVFREAGFSNIKILCTQGLEKIIVLK